MREDLKHGFLIEKLEDDVSKKQAEIDRLQKRVDELEARPHYCMVCGVVKDCEEHSEVHD